MKWIYKLLNMQPVIAVQIVLRHVIPLFRHGAIFVLGYMKLNLPRPMCRCSGVTCGRFFLGVQSLNYLDNPWEPVDPDIVEARN